MIRRVSLLSGFAALAMVAAGSLGQASAGELKRPVFVKPVAPMTLQLNAAPTTQKVTSFSKAIGGPAVSSAGASNLQIQDNTKLGFGGHTLQLNAAPTTQSVTSKAVGIHGPAFSDASADNTIIQSNAGGRFQVNAAPTTQSVHSSALSIGGPAVSSAEASNVGSQSNVR